MKRSKIILAFIFSLIGLGIGYVLTNSIQFGMCKVDELVTEASCINSFERVGDPLFYGMAALAIVFLVLLFRPSAVGAWKKFAKWYIPIVTLIFIFYPIFSTKMEEHFLIKQFKSQKQAYYLRICSYTDVGFLNNGLFR